MNKDSEEIKVASRSGSAVSEREEPLDGASLKKSSSTSSSSSSDNNDNNNNSGVNLVADIQMPKPNNINIKTNVYILALIGALSGLTFGYDIGGSGGTFVMPAFRQYWEWDTECFYLSAQRDATGDIKYNLPEDYASSNAFWPDGADPFLDKNSADNCQEFFLKSGISHQTGETVLVDRGEYFYRFYNENLQQKPCKSCCCNPNPDSKEVKESGDISLSETLGCAAGAIVSGWAADKFGRRLALMASSVLFTLGAVLQMATPSEASARYAIMITGRVFGGLGIGAMSMQATLYQGEIAPEKIRGLLVSAQQLMITFGIVMASIFNLGFTLTDIGWRFSYGGNAFITIIMFFLLFLCPESPVWLMMIKNNEASARIVLQKIRDTPEEVEYEIWAMNREKAKQASQEKADWKELFTNKFRNRLRLATVGSLHIIQQLTGINAIMFFGPTIVTIIFGYGIGQYGGLIFNTVNFFATFICIYAIDKYGRLPLLISGSLLCIFGQLLAAIMSCPISIDDDGLWLYEHSEAAGWIIILGICIFIIGFAYSWGPLAWVYGSEALNIRTKTLGMSIGTTLNWLTAALISKLFPIMKERDAMGIHGSFFFFSAWLILGLTIVLFLIPETSGVPLDRMDDLFMNMKIEFAGKKLKKWQPTTN